jgi:cytochrome c peroxidase
MINYKAKILFLLFLFLLILGFIYPKKTTPYPFLEISYFPEMPKSVVNPVTIEGALLGKYLFYDTILSQDHSISCASCHQQKYAFSDSPNQFSTGTLNNKLDRNTMPLFNLSWYPSMFWDGREASIESQVFIPVRSHNEMGLNWSMAENRINKSKFYKPMFRNAFGNRKIDSTLIAFAIAQFERTLISNNSKFDQVLRGEKLLSKDEYEGFGLINDQTKGDCLHCHSTDGNGLGTMLTFSNNGLDRYNSISDYTDLGRAKVTYNESDVGKFKIPSLRNVAISGPYMHDGRFNTLKEVLDFYSEGVNNSYNVDSKMTFAHQGGAQLTEKEKDKIISFLLTLTDSIFITNPEFQNPYK